MCLEFNVEGWKSGVRLTQLLRSGGGGTGLRSGGQKKEAPSKDACDKMRHASVKWHSTGTEANEIGSCELFEEGVWLKDCQDGRFSVFVSRVQQRLSLYHLIDWRDR